MRKLTVIQSAVMALGALLMVVGVILMVVGLVKEVSAPLFGVGAVAFSAMQMMQVYEGDDFKVKRLRRIMVIGDIFFIVSALLMMEDVYHVVFPLMATSIDGYNAYVHYIYNNWVVTLLIGTVLMMYSTLRISSELTKKQS